MSFWYRSDRRSIADTFAGGEASMSDVFSAAYEQMRLVDNTNAEQEALEAARARQIETIFAETGVRIANPDLAPQNSVGPRGERMVRSRAEVEYEWRQALQDVASAHPDKAEIIMRPLDPGAEARRAEERLGVVAASRPGLGTFAAQIAGSAAGMLRDPLQVGTLLLGGGPGAGRTVATRILTAATREALVNGAVEAAMQPQVQAWREKAGLDAGLDIAFRNVGFAAAFGGLFGAAGQGLAEGASRLAGRSLDAAGAQAAMEPAIRPEIRAAMNGDMAAARAELPEIRDSLPAAARGALDHAEILDHLETNRPRVAAPERNDELVSEAHRAADEFRQPDFRPDEAQIARIVDEMLGPEPLPLPARQSLVEFLSARGVLDQNGEMAAIGAQDLTRSRARRGRPDRRMTLDQAREAAEEAGYIGRADETQVTSVRDLLDAVDREMRGEKIFAREDGDAPAARAEHETRLSERRAAEDVVAELQSYAGPAIDDQVLRRAAEISLRDGIDPFDALENVFVRMDDAAAPATRTGEIPPGWSDAELEAAAARRGDPPGTYGGLDDPAEFADAPAFSREELDEFGELAIPGDDGELVPLATMMADVAKIQDAARMLENCRL